MMIIVLRGGDSLRTRLIPLILGLLLPSLPAALLAQTSPRDGSAVPLLVLAHIRLDTTLGELIAEHRDSLAAYLVAEPLDLNGDGVPELVIRGKGAICGAINCIAWVYGRTVTGYARLLDAGSIQHLEPQQRRRRGYRDVMTSMHGSAWDGTLALFRFDGQRYRLARCFTYTYRVVDAQGRVRDLEQRRVTPVPCAPADGAS